MFEGTTVPKPASSAVNRIIREQIDYAENLSNHHSDFTCLLTVFYC